MIRSQMAAGYQAGFKRQSRKCLCEWMVGDHQEL